MDQRLKQRLVGAAVLVALAVIFLPMLFERPQEREVAGLPQAAPPEPKPRSSGPKLAPVAVTPPPARPAEPVEEGDAPPVATPVAPPAPAAPPPGRGTAPPPAASAAPPPAADSWVVQVASVAAKEGADALAARLKAAGYAAFVEGGPHSRSGLYRVRVGPELALANAKGLRDKLEKEQRLKGVVMRYP